MAGDIGLLAVLQGVRTVAEGAVALQKITSGDAQAKAVELYNLILSAQARTMEAHINANALSEEVSALKAEIERMNTWAEEKTRYAMVDQHKGLFVYALRQTAANGEPAHWLCANCYEVGRKSTLQSEPKFDKTTGHACRVFCPNRECGFSAQLSRSDMPVRYAE